MHQRIINTEIIDDRRSPPDPSSSSSSCLSPKTQLPTPSSLVSARRSISSRMRRSISIPPLSMGNNATLASTWPSFNISGRVPQAAFSNVTLSAVIDGVKEIERSKLPAMVSSRPVFSLTLRARRSLNLLTSWTLNRTPPTTTTKRISPVIPKTTCHQRIRIAHTLPRRCSKTGSKSHILSSTSSAPAAFNSTVSW